MASYQAGRLAVANGVDPTQAARLYEHGVAVAKEVVEARSTLMTALMERDAEVVARAVEQLNKLVEEGSSPGANGSSPGADSKATPTPSGS